MDQEFGSAYARTLAHDQVLGALSDRTVAQALEDGEEPRTVWLALCDAMEVPAERRWLAEHGASRRTRR